MGKKKLNDIRILIYSYNAEDEIKECINSAKLLSNKITVIDQESLDKSADIAKEERADVLIFPHQSYVEPSREFGIKQVKEDWIFILDTDERITPMLVKEIKESINLQLYTHYKIPRKNIFGKTKWLSHGGWWPDHQTRLILKKAFRAWPAQIHSTPIIEGKIGYLKNPFLHFFHGDIENMVNKTIIFEDIEAELLFKAGKSSSTSVFYRKFCGELYRRLFKKMGFLDGNIGIIESIYQAFSKAITYLLVYEKKNSRTL